MKKSTKIMIHRYGAFTVIMIVLFFLVFMTVVFSRGVWKKSLKLQVENILSNNYGELYSVGDYITLKTPVNVSAAAYSVLDSKNKENGMVVIIRITGLAGPIPAVYFAKPGTNIFLFEGLADSNFSSSRNNKLTNIMLNQISYWGQKIPLFLQDGVSL